MSEYKYLVMQSNAKNNVGFLTASFGGSHRSANADTNDDLVLMSNISYCL